MWLINLKLMVKKMGFVCFVLICMSVVAVVSFFRFNFIIITIITFFFNQIWKIDAPRFCARPGSQPDIFLAFSGVSIPQQKSASANEIGNCTNNT